MSGFLKLFNRTDLITFIYCIINVFYIIFGFNRIEEASFLLISFVNIILALIFIAFFDKYLSNKMEKFSAKIFQFLHLWYAPIMYGFFFEATSKVNRLLFRNFLDPIFQNYDQLIFTYQPAIIWEQVWNGFFIQEVLHFSYFAYYLMILGIPLYLYLKSDKKIFKQAVFNISFVFYACYLIYMFLPVIGGRALEGAYELTIQYRYGVFTHIMAFIYRTSTHLGGAFPSSHVAIALTITLISLKHFKYLQYLLICITILLTISTVYCHYHYFIDAIAGLFYGTFMYLLSEYFYKRVKSFDKKTKETIYSS